MLSIKGWKWRFNWLREGIQYLVYGGKLADEDAKLKNRLRFFIGTLRILLPLPGKISKKMGIKFTLGLKCLTSLEKEKIYERSGINYYIPDDLLYEFFKMFKGIVIHQHYEEPPVVVNKGDVIIDCGANLGITTAYFAKRAGKEGIVVAVEPENKNFNILYKTIELNKENFAKVILVKKAVYKENTFLDFCITRKSGHHFLAPYAEEEQKKMVKKERVEAITIDSLVKELNLARVDFIKMDIEGAEIDALLGAEETIKKYLPKLAICSYHRPTDSYEIKRIIRLFNPKYEYKELEKGEKVIFAWDPRKIS